jgi:hypothetical protein
MVDNFDRIRDLIHFELNGDMYFVEIIWRGKDHGTTGERNIRDYHIKSFQQWDSLKDRIKAECDRLGARALIRLNQRNVQEANLYVQIEILRREIQYNATIRKAIRHGDASMIMVGNRVDPATGKPFKFPRLKSAASLYANALGKYNSEDRSTTKWIIDIDADLVKPDVEGFRSVEEISETYMKFINEACTPVNGDKKIAVLNSRTGIHLITKPFNTKTFTERFGTDSKGHSLVKDDGVTNLYIPDIKEE